MGSGYTARMSAIALVLPVLACITLFPPHISATSFAARAPFSDTNSQPQSHSLLPRGGQSSVICSSDFLWAENQQSLNPCIVAASLQGACNSATWEVKKLDNGTVGYDPNLTPDKCSCSWAVYNLLSACTACQGYPNAIRNWAYVSQSDKCKPFLSEGTFFPADTPIGGQQTIPFWATTNPTTWQDGRFNVEQAKKLATQDDRDVSPTSSQSAKKESPIPAIIGGVVGGLAILALGVLGAWFIVRRNRSRASGTRELIPRTLRHMRSFSDDTMSMAHSSKTMTTFMVPPIMPSSPTSPMTIRTHAASSVHSLPHSHSPGRGTSVFSVPASSVRNQSIVAQLPREEIIQPFILTNPSSPPPPTVSSADGRPPFHRKGTSDSSVASSLPVVRVPEDPPLGAVAETEIGGHGRRRVNPPAYPGTPNSTPPPTSSGRPGSGADAGSRTTSPPPGSSAVATRGHNVNPGSLDSQRSWDTLETRRTVSPTGVILATNGLGQLHGPGHRGHRYDGSVDRSSAGSDMPIA